MYRGIPPWHRHDQVTISDEAKRRFQKMVDDELESRKPISGQPINVDIEDDPFEKNSSGGWSLPFCIGFGVFFGSLTVGTALLVHSVIKVVTSLF